MSLTRRTLLSLPVAIPLLNLAARPAAGDESDHVVAVAVDPLPDNGSDDRIESWAVAASREQSDPHSRNATWRRPTIGFHRGWTGS